MNRRLPLPAHGCAQRGGDGRGVCGHDRLGLARRASRSPSSKICVGRSATSRPGCTRLPAPREAGGRRCSRRRGRGRRPVHRTQDDRGLPLTVCTFGQSAKGAWFKTTVGNRLEAHDSVRELLRTAFSDRERALVVRGSQRMRQASSVARRRCLLTSGYAVPTPASTGVSWCASALDQTVAESGSQTRSILKNSLDGPGHAETGDERNIGQLRPRRHLLG